MPGESGLNYDDCVSEIVQYLFNYDNLNRLQSKADSRGRSLSFTWDASGRMQTKTTYQGSTTSYTYDGAGTLASISNPDYLTVNYQFDNAGHLLSRTMSSGARSYYGYDNGGWLQSISHTDTTGSTVFAQTLAKDRVGNTTSVSVSTGPATGTTNYTLDALYRLTSVAAPTAANSEAYSYDHLGNRLTVTSGGSSIGATGSTTKYYVYSPATNTGDPGYTGTLNNRLSQIHIGSVTGTLDSSFVFDNEGRTTSQSGSTVRSMTWDAKGRLATLTQNGYSETYQYDTTNHRIGRSGGPLGNLSYYLEGENLESVESGGVLQERYFRGATTDELVAGYTLQNGVMTPVLFDHDQEMSVVVQAPLNGGTQAMNSFSAFGLSQVTVGTPVTRLAYTGRENDGMGVYYYRARYYNPSIGQFISEDPKRFAAGQNFLAYVGNNPVNANDPTGLCPNANICQAALNVAGANGSAVTRANSNWDTIQSAATANGIDPNLLAAIGVRETGFQNIAQIGGGKGAGVFQIDLGKNPGVTSAQAYNIAYAANFAANMLAASADTLASEYPSFSPAQLLQATAASYNFGTGNISGNPNTIDVGSTGGNYGSNVVGLMSCFCSKNTSINTTSLPSNASFSEIAGMGGASFTGADGGFLIYPNKPNTNQVQQVYSK